MIEADWWRAKPLAADRLIFETAMISRARTSWNRLGDAGTLAVFFQGEPGPLSGRQFSFEEITAHECSAGDQTAPDWW